MEYVTAFGFNDESGGLYRDLEQNLEASLHEDAFWWPQVKILQPSLTRTGGRNCLIVRLGCSLSMHWMVICFHFFPSPLISCGRRFHSAHGQVSMEVFFVACQLMQCLCLSSVSKVRYLLTQFSLSMCCIPANSSRNKL